jgi:hypothetical protein
VKKSTNYVGLMIMKTQRILWWGRRCAGLIIAIVVCATGHAAPVILTDGNSSAQIFSDSQAGMNSWIVEGQNQLAHQWFWYRIGANPEQSIDTIGIPVVVTTLGTRGMTATYANPQFSLQIDYLLTGGVAGSGVSDIAETIKIQNLTGAYLDFHFFQYSDFNLGGTAGNDTLQLSQNIAGKYNDAVQYDAGVAFSETVTAPGANHGEAAFAGITLAKLNNGVADNLSDASGPLNGDVTWAFQWDFSIAPGSSKIISKDKYLEVLVIPEPTSVVFGALGLAFMLGMSNRRR